MHSQQVEIIVRHGGTEVGRHRFAPGEYVIGRAPGCAVELCINGVSGRHAKLIVANDSVSIEDLGSTNGTFVGNQRITARTSIGRGMLFEIGDVVLEWRVVAAMVAKGKPAAVLGPVAGFARGQGNPGPAVRPSRVVPAPARSSFAIIAAVLVALSVGGIFLAKVLNWSGTKSAQPENVQASDRTDNASVPVIAADKPAPAVIARIEPPAPAPVPVPPKVTPQPMSPPTPETKPQAPVATKPADDYPGVPVLNLSPGVPAGGPDFQRLLAAAKWAGANGKWDRLHSDLTNALVALGGSGSSVARPANIEKMVGLHMPSAVFAQERFIGAVGESVLNAFTADRDRAAFIQWLFARPAILAAFDETIQPQDAPREALEAWWKIWTSDEEGREQFANLAIACALVFDKPVRINPAIFGTDGSQSQADSPGFEKEASAVGHYRFFRNSAKSGALRAPIAEMTPGDLVWVVDAPVPESELVWAQKHVNLSRQTWSKAYGMIRYRMDRATQGVNPYKAYTLAEILKEGGICGDQAYFAAITAKANGIPAMAISGEGDRGSHAWFGYKVSRNSWNLTTGRYNDSYAAGSTRHPQTQQRLKEHEMKVHADPVRRTEAYAKSEQLVSLAKVFAGAKREDLAAVAIDGALKLTPRNLDAWFARMAALRTAKLNAEDWKREVARMRTAFHGYSDVLQQIGEMEAGYVAQLGDLDAARKLVRRDAARMGTKDKERTDLILDAVFREADLAEATGDAERIGRIYRDAMRDKGDEVVAFKKIATRYYDWGKKSDKGEAAVRDIVRTFDQKHKEPTGDVFAIGAYRGALGQIIAMVKEQGMTAQERSLERREAKLKTLEEKIGKEQSKNAARQGG